MTKKKKPSNNKMKTVTVNSHIISYPTPISSTNASSEGGGAESMLQELCRNINDLAFCGPGNSLKWTTIMHVALTNKA
jgi:hypothetical protein